MSGMRAGKWGMEIVVGVGERKVLKLLGLWCQGIGPGFLPPCASSEMT